MEGGVGRGYQSSPQKDFVKLWDRHLTSSVILKDVSDAADNRGAELVDKRDYEVSVSINLQVTKSSKMPSEASLESIIPIAALSQMLKKNSKKFRSLCSIIRSGKKANGDRFGHNTPGGSPFGGFSGGSFNINLEDILGGDFFSSFFGGGSRRSRNRGNDVIVRFSVNLESIYDGSSEELEIELPTTCESCDGTGAEDGDITHVAIVAAKEKYGQGNKSDRLFKM